MHFLKVERQLAANTITSYQQGSDDYIEFIENTEIESIDAVTRQRYYLLICK